MAYDSRVYRILIASPSDVLEEREAAVRVIQDWNDLHSHTRRVVMLPLRWETHTAPEYNVRPQEAVNRRIVDDCDLLLGIFWTRLGTPTGEAESGTLEEIQRVAAAGKPVMLYFSHVPRDPNDVDFAQLDRLKHFRKEISSSALIQTFSSALDFRNRFASQIELKLRDLQKEDERARPAPLELHFVALETQQLVGSSMATKAELLDVPEAPVSVDSDLKPYLSRVLAAARGDLGLRVALALKNIGSNGIRSLYVEVTISCMSGAFSMTESGASHQVSIGSWLGLSSTMNRAEEELEGLSDGLTERDGAWRFEFAWQALQPKRARIIRPIMMVWPSADCVAEFRAKVFADSFVNPIELTAQLSVAANRRPVSLDDLVAKAQELRKDEDISGITIVSPVRYGSLSAGWPVAVDATEAPES